MQKLYIFFRIAYNKKYYHFPIIKIPPVQGERPQIKNPLQGPFHLNSSPTELSMSWHYVSTLITWKQVIFLFLPFVYFL